MERLPVADSVRKIAKKKPLAVWSDGVRFSGYSSSQR